MSADHSDRRDREGVCACGCGGQTTFYRGRYQKYITRHHKRLQGPDYIEEDRGYETPCWVWLRCKNTRGYARLGGRLAHRIYYERTHGAIGNLQLDHLCFTTDCVNPDHLEAVTHIINQHRRRDLKLTPVQVAWIRDLHAMGFRGADIARFYGVSTGTIYNTVKRRQWGSVT